MVITMMATLAEITIRSSITGIKKSYDLIYWMIYGDPYANNQKTMMVNQTRMLEYLEKLDRRIKDLEDKKEE